MFHFQPSSFKHLYLSDFFRFFICLEAAVLFLESQIGRESFDQTAFTIVTALQKIKWIAQRPALILEKVLDKLEMKKQQKKIWQVKLYF